jgi:hypothetical protein
MWEWAIQKEKGGCKCEANSQDIFFDFDQALDKYEGTYVFRYQSDGLNYFYNLQNDTIARKEISLVGYLTCEKDMLSARLFLYNHSTDVLMLEHLVTAECGMKNFGYYVAEKFEGILKGNINSNSSSEFTSVKFDEANRPRSMNSLYSKHIEYDRKIKNSIPPECDNPNRLKCVGKILENYLSTQNYEFIEDIKKCIRNNPGKRCGKFDEKMPKLYNILYAISYLEGYRRAPSINERKLMINNLYAVADTLLMDDKSMNSRESKLFRDAGFSYDTIAQRFGQAIKVVLSCESILSKDYKNRTDELNAYMSVLSNEDISPLLIDLGEDNKDCFALKNEALRRSERILNSLQGDYTLNRNIADSLHC